MRKDIYNLNVVIFLKALRNLGWKDVTPNKRLHSGEFVKEEFHLILKRRKIGYYCLIHKDRVALGRHVKPIAKSDELLSVYNEIVKEYQRLLSH